MPTHIARHTKTYILPTPTDRTARGNIKTVERDDMGKDFKKQLLSVFCKRRLRLDGCQGATIEWFHQAESLCVCVCVCSNYFTCVE